MKFKVEVTRAGGEPAVVTISPLAIVGWEKKTGRRMSGLAEEGGLGMLDMAVMAMEQERLSGLTTETKVEAWLSDVEELGPAPDDAHPTEEGL